MLHRWQIFKDLEESGRLTGILLLIATAISMLLANSVVSVSYIGFWEIKVGAGPLYKTVHHWVNDGLMAAFFLLVGLEIKRELLDGELASPRKAALPLVAALGGVVLPAVIYISFNAGLPSMTGWAIPMATDIAFSLGILSMLGRRVPASLKIFLTALAVIDDLFAIVIIAVFYTHQLAATYLIYAGIVLVGLFLMNRFGILTWWLYVLAGLLLWFFVLKSGIHATLAGVMLALCIPSDILEDMEHALTKPVNYLILPVFALANTAISFSAVSLSDFFTPLSLGIMIGLVFGKTFGIFSFTYLGVKSKLCDLSSDIQWSDVVGMGAIAGIGFTMSIFISLLSFTDRTMIDRAILSVIAGSVISALVGVLIFRLKK